MKSFHWFAAIVGVLSVAATGLAQEKTAVVKRGPIKVVYDLTGTVASGETRELEFDNEQLTELKVEQVVDHGQVVSRDQELLSLQSEPLEKKASELKRAHRLAELTYREKQLEAQQAEELQKLTVAAKERELEHAEADFQYWEEVTWPQRREDIDDSQQRSRESLEDAQMEYDQLKQMYEEDELVEESEELVLRRQERNLERSKKNFERSEQRYQRNIEVDLPRQEREYRDNHRRTILRLQKEIEMLDDQFEKEQIEIEKARIAFEKATEDQEKLDQELEHTQLTAPFDGVVYHGPWPVSGKTAKVESDDKVAAKTTLLTIASLEKLHLTVPLTEAQLAQIKPGINGYAIPTAFPKDVVTVRVRSIDHVPTSDKKFDCELTMQEAPTGWLPGMTGSVKLQAYQNDAALLVPDAAVHTDNGSDHYVFVASESATESNDDIPDAEEADEEASEGSTSPDTDWKKVPVTIGMSADGQTEILSGLNQGDKVLLGRPQ